MRMKALVVDDDRTSHFILKRMLEKHGFEVDIALDGCEAIQRLDESAYRLIITDWLMPAMNGIELIKRIRATRGHRPYILMLTTIEAPNKLRYAKEVGANCVMSKPLQLSALRELMEKVGHGRPSMVMRTTTRVDVESALREVRQSRERRNQRRSAGQFGSTTLRMHPMSIGNAPFVGVGIAASTGGPPVLDLLLSHLPIVPAALFIVQHGPQWVQGQLVERLSGKSRMPVRLARDGERILPENVYVAPAGSHLTIADGYRFALRYDPPENGTRPAADPLLRSMSRTFGHRALSVVLTGLGKDATSGSAALFTVGGGVIVQKPESATAPFMPQSVLNAGVAATQCGVDDLANAVVDEVRKRQPSELVQQGARA